MTSTRWTILSKCIILLGGLLTLSGCLKNSPEPNLEPLELEYNLNIPLNDDFDTCSGERVTITGSQHIVGRFTQDQKGHLHFGFTRNTHGTGTGQVSGAKYLLTDTVNRASLEVIAGETRTFLEQYQEHLMRVGGNTKNDDALVHLLSKITINANGTVTSSVEFIKAECK
jgi:hypothetical protein